MMDQLQTFCHVDDMLVAGKHARIIHVDDTDTHLNQSFECNDLGNAQCYLGIKWTEVKIIHFLFIRGI
jgi:hypothetical protein